MKIPHIDIEYGHSLHTSQIRRLDIDRDRRTSDDIDIGIGISIGGYLLVHESG